MVVLALLLSPESLVVESAGLLASPAGAVDLSSLLGVVVLVEASPVVVVVDPELESPEVLGLVMVVEEEVLLIGAVEFYRGWLWSSLILELAIEAREVL